MFPRSKGKIGIIGWWDTVQNNQSLHQLILKIERICVGFDDHKQNAHNLVQAMKTLFIYTQTDSTTTRRSSDLSVRPKGVEEECLHRLYQIINFLFVIIETDIDPLDF